MESPPCRWVTSHADSSSCGPLRPALLKSRLHHVGKQGTTQLWLWCEIWLVIFNRHVASRCTVNKALSKNDAAAGMQSIVGYMRLRSLVTMQTQNRLKTRSYFKCSLILRKLGRTLCYDVNDLKLHTLKHAEPELGHGPFQNLRGKSRDPERLTSNILYIYSSRWKAFWMPNLLKSTIKNTI